VTCREASARGTDLYDGRLDTAAQVRLHDHLEGCAACRAQAEMWTRLLPAMRAVQPPPLDEMQVRRLEVAVEREREQSARPRLAQRRPFAWALPVLVGGAAAALLVVRLSRPGGDGPVRLSAEVRRAHRASVVAGTTLGAEQTLAVAKGGEAELVLGPGTTASLHGPARLTLRGSAADVELALAEGVLDAVVAHRRPGETFAVTASGARVVVRGTRFTVSAGASGSWVRVDEGRVGVLGPGNAERAVSAGETLALAAPAAEALPHALAPAVEAQATEVPAREPDTTDAASAAEACGPARACAATARQARLAMRAGAHRRALAIISSAAETAESDAGGEACRDVRTSCQRELGYLQAEALRLDGRLEAAVGAYKRLDQRGAPSATRQNALYAAAQLEQRLGHAAAARADYERALAAAPAGALNAEALLGAMESASEAHEPDAARALARRYLGRFPDGPGAARARLLTGGWSTGSSIVSGPRE
jgi:hypothetical protein